MLLYLKFCHRIQLTRRYENSGLTPLHLAASLGDTEIANLLLHLGAPVGNKAFLLAYFCSGSITLP